MKARLKNVIRIICKEIVGLRIHGMIQHTKLHIGFVLRRGSLRVILWLTQDTVSMVIMPDYQMEFVLVFAYKQTNKKRQ